MHSLGPTGALTHEVFSVVLDPRTRSLLGGGTAVHWLAWFRVDALLLEDGCTVAEHSRILRCCLQLLNTALTEERLETGRTIHRVRQP